MNKSIKALFFMRTNPEGSMSVKLTGIRSASREDKISLLDCTDPDRLTVLWLRLELIREWRKYGKQDKKIWVCQGVPPGPE